MLRALIDQAGDSPAFWTRFYTRDPQDIIPEMAAVSLYSPGHGLENLTDMMGRLKSGLRIADQGLADDPDNDAVQGVVKAYNALTWLVDEIGDEGLGAIGGGAIGSAAWDKLVDDVAGRLEKNSVDSAVQQSTQDTVSTLKDIENDFPNVWKKISGGGANIYDDERDFELAFEAASGMNFSTVAGN